MLTKLVMTLWHIGKTRLRSLATTIDVFEIIILVNISNCPMGISTLKT